MSDLLRSIILGIIQGLTEFLPVSSSGHLEIAEAILGDVSAGYESLFFTIMVHVATALSTVFVFRKDIANILSEIFKKPWNESQAFVLNVVISMIPAGLIGFFLEPVIETFFEQQILFVGCMLLVTAVLLVLADRSNTTDKRVGPFDAFIIGIAQAVALLPGISRSGSTIAASVMLGIDRYNAARFSFLMVVPLILGKIAYDLVSGDLSIASNDVLPVSAGFIAAFVTGAVACRWMIALVRKSKLWYFAVYCSVIGLVAILYSLLS